MFSGIIATVGHIAAVAPLQEGLRLSVDTQGWCVADVALGDSIACNGVCLTVVAMDKSILSFDVSRETLHCTCGLDTLGKSLNLEKAMRLSDRIGGHLVSGHVDGQGQVLRLDALGESHELVIRVPEALAPYIAQKGSISINGVSLTVNWVEDFIVGGSKVAADLSINLIPHTFTVTTLGSLTAGSWVNVEVDLIARHVERMLEWKENPQEGNI